MINFVKSRWITFLIGGLLIVGIFTSYFFLIFLEGSRDRESVAVGEDDVPQLALRNFYQIQGREYYIANISNVRPSSFTSFIGGMRWYSFGDSGGQARNVVFMDGESLKSHKLYETNDSLFISIEEFPKSINPQNSSEKQILIPVNWFIYYVIHEDKNQDGFLNENDNAVIAISDFDGYRYKEILTDVLGIYSYDISEHGELLVVYKTSDGRYASKFSMQTQELILTESLPNMGDEVE